MRFLLLYAALLTLGACAAARDAGAAGRTVRPQRPPRRALPRRSLQRQYRLAPCAERRRDADYLVAGRRHRAHRARRRQRDADDGRAARVPGGGRRSAYRGSARVPRPARGARRVGARQAFDRFAGQRRLRARRSLALAPAARLECRVSRVPGQPPVAPAPRPTRASSCGLPYPNGNEVVSGAGEAESLSPRARAARNRRTCGLSRAADGVSPHRPRRPRRHRVARRRRNPIHRRIRRGQSLPARRTPAQG